MVQGGASVTRRLLPTTYAARILQQQLLLQVDIPSTFQDEQKMVQAFFWHDPNAWYFLIWLPIIITSSLWYGLVDTSSRSLVAMHFLWARDTLYTKAQRRGEARCVVSIKQYWFFFQPTNQPDLTAVQEDTWCRRLWTVTKTKCGALMRRIVRWRPTISCLISIAISPNVQ